MFFQHQALTHADPWLVYESMVFSNKRDTFLMSWELLSVMENKTIFHNLVLEEEGMICNNLQKVNFTRKVI